jgi:flagellar hook assembly protein FlgD
MGTWGNVELTLFDLLGQRATLAGGAYEAGEHLVRWDGRDQLGRDLPSGVYLCYMRAEGWTQTRRRLIR